MIYIVCGCIQGTGMNADKFFDVCNRYEADDIEAAAATARAEGVWVEKVTLHE